MHDLRGQVFAYDRCECLEKTAVDDLRRHVCGLQDRCTRSMKHR